MSESGNDNLRPATDEGGAPPEPPTVAPVAEPEPPTAPPPWQPPVYAAPPAPSAGRGRSGWVVLAVGLGCLAPIVLGLLFWGAAALFLHYRASLHGGSRAGSAFSLRLGRPPSGAAYAAHVRSRQYTFRGAPADGDLRRFDSQLEGWVFAQNGAQAQADVGDVVSYAAETEFSSDGASGVSVVTLGGESGRKVRLYVSCGQEMNGAWEFKLDMYR